ncbi:MAG: DNA repair protein RecO [Chitinophagaceae bacterium]|jgi:DNA repair protein RecO (recombination protein O)|nr:DNA repair protein RecO [Chitinophagaceae bacterium]
MIHKTNGIVLRTVKYGETSIIATVYTELFGVQSYIVKGIRKPAKTAPNKVSYFQPGAILSMEVFHNHLKNLQFIKEYEWAYLYKEVFFNVLKNTIGTYIVELLHNAIKQPEPNPDFYFQTEYFLKQLDILPQSEVANIPLFFTAYLSKELGFEFHGSFSEALPVLDLQEGKFVKDIPDHLFYIMGTTAQVISHLKQSMYSNSDKTFGTLKLGRNIRREILDFYQQYFSLHLQNFISLKSWPILMNILD